MSGNPHGTPETDALLSSAIAEIEKLEALVSMLSSYDDKEKRRAPISQELRAMAELLERLPALAHDLANTKRMLRGMLTIDPEQTPRPLAFRRSDPDTRLSNVEERERTWRDATRPGIGKRED